MQHASPWALGSRTDRHGVPRPNQDPVDSRTLDPIIYVCAESIRVCAILLQTVMPGKMKHVLDLMGVDEGKRMFRDAVLGGDRDYGVPMVDVGRGRTGVVFPPLASEF